MSPYPLPLNPSQTVERIREIIVGRHLERLEQRVALLETGVTSSPMISPPMDERHLQIGDPLEALQDNVERLMETNRQQTDLRLSQNREETQRLAIQIQKVAAMKASGSAPLAVHQLERRIGTWLSDWQSSLQVHLQDRDARIATQLRNEVGALRARNESQLAQLESHIVDRKFLDERFNRIAIAARALAECMSPSAFTPGPAI